MERHFSDADLHALLAALPTPVRQPGAALQRLVDEGLDRLPHPASGSTLQRWRGLAAVAASDLSLCKLYEGHTDALAIIAEVQGDYSLPSDSTWGMWAAEPPQAKVQINARTSAKDVRLDGLKAWCSGAKELSHALLTCWDEEGQQQLVAVALQQPGINVTDQGWHAVGMAATASVEVRFDQARGHLIGPPGAYLDRPGFWHGGAGIGVCWFGAAQALAEALRSHCRKRPEPHALAHLGALDSALGAAADSLRAGAAWIDQQPYANAERLVRRLRSQCEYAAAQAIEHVGRALGAGPYCRDEKFAQLLADLPVYVRQSHAERDLAAQGERVADEPEGSWML
ncbi:hypothetical protein ACVW0Y_004230 [Pseudomonas sp. TE3786]